MSHKMTLGCTGVKQLKQVTQQMSELEIKLIPKSILLALPNNKLLQKGEVLTVSKGHVVPPRVSRVDQYSTSEANAVMQSV